MLVWSEASLPGGSRNRPIEIDRWTQAARAQQVSNLDFLSELEGFGA
jgi:hypothetical protein